MQRWKKIGGFGLSVAAKLINQTEYEWIGLSDFTGFPWMIFIVFSICFGALGGDVIESFFKRRAGRNRGEDWIPFDQIDFILGVLFFSFLMASLLDLLSLTDENWFFSSLKIEHVLILLVVTPFFHLLSNYLHRKIKEYNARK